MKLTLSALLLVTGMFVHIAAGEELKTIEDVLRFSSDKSEAYQSFAADLTQTMNLMGTTMSVGGHMEFKRPALMRYDISMQAMGQGQKILCVMGADKIVWQEMNIGPTKQIIKMDFTKIPTNSPAGSNPFDKMDPKQQWRAAQEKYDFKLTGTDELHGQRMYIVVGTPRSNATWTAQETMVGMNTAKDRVHIGQQDGFMHKMELIDKSGTNTLLVMDFTNLKFNTDIPDSQFVYKPSADAQVMDMTPMLLQQMSAPNAPPPATTPQKIDKPLPTR
jgi:outer membrane lipoprotein-sorting protein